MIYHVMILYPELFADFYGECYVWSGEAASEGKAICQAKLDMVEANADSGLAHNDLVVSLVIKGGEVL